MPATENKAALLQQSLRDIVLGILSMAAIQGTERVRLTDFYQAFERVFEAHKSTFPPMRFTKNSYSVYSKRLDDALQSLIGYSISLPNPSLQYLELKTDVAIRSLAWLRDKYGSEVDGLEPLTKDFLREVRSRTQATAPAISATP
jgi:hypothetical protein